ncbi:DNA-binding PadR family transcriptional regulator [Kibdelosporangium banguiense]|uniref:DNA-binding PadR family transcriptional regulator n=1 Tax=Kibdelosporangium banguiense TaxID=1365924 RepID=A0ABS4TEE8_9PSEU|nr:PadR family transcriptional regulator [Kibdelosporangium banguiense]MBP2322792.1 DNA-binding PadR family transcriptional regulator [Kibdelosporangium banguiense]
MNLSPLALLVLELLAEREMHPYEMRQLLARRGRDRRIRVTPGSLYRSVERLAEDGLAEVVETSREGRRPERTVYAITGAGREAFAYRLREMLAKPVDEFPQYPVALVCMHALGKQDALDQLARRRVELEAEIARSQTTGPREVFMVDLDYSQAIRRAELSWTTQLIEDLTSGRLGWPERAAQ